MDVISYCYDSSLIRSPEFFVSVTETDEKTVYERVKEAKKRYQFGMYLGSLSGRRHLGFDEAEIRDSNIVRSVHRFRHTLNEREKLLQRQLRFPKIDSEPQDIYDESEGHVPEGEQSPTGSRNSNNGSQERQPIESDQISEYGDIYEDEQISVGAVRRTDTEMEIGLELPPNGQRCQ